MDQFVIFPTNENGIFDQAILVNKTIQDAMSQDFDFGDVFVYSHGWLTIANAAMIAYGQYTVEFTKHLRSIEKKLSAPPLSTFGLGIHWPSTLSEDDTKLNELLNTGSYYAMGARANQVGHTGLYATLNLMLAERCTANKPFRLNIIGHSFGCRVVASALQRIYTEVCKRPADDKLRKFVLGLEVNAVLLQAAFKRQELDANGDYGQLANWKKLRLLVTSSQFDDALNVWFGKAEKDNNMFHARDAVALGAGISPLIQGGACHNPDSNVEISPKTPGGGPTEAATLAFTGSSNANVFQVKPNLDGGTVPRVDRLLLADLSPVHRARIISGDWNLKAAGFGGSHSDICTPEIHDLIAAFCFNNA